MNSLPPKSAEAMSWLCCIMMASTLPHSLAGTIAAKRKTGASLKAQWELCNTFISDPGPLTNKNNPQSVSQVGKKKLRDQCEILSQFKILISLTSPKDLNSLIRIEPIEIRLAAKFLQDKDLAMSQISKRPVLILYQPEWEVCRQIPPRDGLGYLSSP